MTDPLDKLNQKGDSPVTGAAVGGVFGLITGIVVLMGGHFLPASDASSLNCAEVRQVAIDLTVKHPEVNVPYDGDAEGLCKVNEVTQQVRDSLKKMQSPP